MKQELKFYYPYRWEKQLAAFQGVPDLNVKQPAGDGHISLGGSLLCHRQQIELEAELKADGGETVSTRRSGTAICPDCQDRWKKLPGNPWRAWVKQEAKRV